MPLARYRRRGRPAPLPRKIAPQLATLATSAVEPDQEPPERRLAHAGEEDGRTGAHVEAGGEGPQHAGRRVRPRGDPSRPRGKARRAFGQTSHRDRALEGPAGRSRPPPTPQGRGLREGAPERGPRSAAETERPKKKPNPPAVAREHRSFEARTQVRHQRFLALDAGTRCGAPQEPIATPRVGPPGRAHSQGHAPPATATLKPVTSARARIERGGSLLLSPRLPAA